MLLPFYHALLMAAEHHRRKKQMIRLTGLILNSQSLNLRWILMLPVNHTVHSYLFCLKCPTFHPLSSLPGICIASYFTEKNEAIKRALLQSLYHVYLSTKYLHQCFHISIILIELYSQLLQWIYILFSQGYCFSSLAYSADFSFFNL